MSACNAAYFDCLPLELITLAEKANMVCYTFDGWGGGAKKSVWTPSSNTVELEERITNLLLK